ncbi:TniQ family protein [Paenibacillus oenotherae]|uniref:TniQ family protein n=1 Tax=Paenibacillus oenotherae TaxID=1435645 RepID=A0ABS7D4A3_9BACL|nr:TniQ family protein [Paenibacillus oenotherae]MBW7474321.1 TniQ family protein [Paenibacillus oenotherae]
MLLRRPSKFPKESVSSFIFRLAIANHRPVSTFLSLFGIRWANWLKNSFSNEQLRKIAERANINPSTLEDGLFHWFESDAYYLKNRVKFCPDCYRESAFHRTFWGLIPITTCLQHNSLLLDTCSNCDTPIKLEELMIGVCKKCQNKFKKFEAIHVEVNSIIYEQQVAIQNSLHTNSKMLSIAKGFSAYQFLLLAKHSFHLLEQLPSFLDENRKNKIFQNHSGGYKSNHSAAESYALVFWSYQDFPHRFNKMLSKFVEKPRRTLYMQKKVFESLFNNEGFEVIKQEYELFWAMELEKGTVRRNLSVFKKNTDLLEQKGHYRKEETKQLTGMSYPKLESLHEAGTISIISRKNGGTMQHFIDKASVTYLLEEKQNYINKREVAQILGVQRASVSQLLKEGLLKEAGTVFSPYKLIRHNEVLELLKKSTGLLNIHIEGLKFHQVLIKYSVNGLTICKLLKLIHQKALSPQLAVPNGNLSDVWFWEDELQQCNELLKTEKKNKDGLYMKDVLEYLNIGEKKLKRLMDSGELKPDRVIVWKDGRKRYLFHVTRIEEFKKNLR